MDEFNHSLNHGTGSSPRSSSNSSRSHFSQLSRQARLERIRRTIRARTSDSLEARRRRSLGLLPGENIGGESSSATASPGKRRKIEQHQAQIDMAQLELELAYCDGGKHKEANTRPEAVLYENEEVYRTKTSECNMIFQHVSAKCFTLKKMVIQGPSMGYMSPVQEGMIFVTMDKDDLAPACRYPFHLENHEDDDGDDDDNDLDESDDDELNDLEFPLLEPCEHSPSAYRGSPANFFELDRTEPRLQAEETHMEPSARFKIRREDRGNKVKATLTFEPALSGRFILARFFSPSRRENIDIQFIGAYGYVGRRFFPAIHPR
ncbi:hypothetical protein EV426DRAFT_571298 [Tirmania nivea]|nr:hypothetical protein EV426DRAFT_571298 [Tirmania nivea]